jgi:hypothetical protein
MVKRLLALWLIFPPATQVSAYAGLCWESRPDRHELLTCRDHCERARKAAPRKPCHQEPRKDPQVCLSDACHSREGVQIVATANYLLPEMIAAPLHESAVVLCDFRARDPLLGFTRLDLPPPRTAS